MDKNGYNPSLLPSEPLNSCLLCGIRGDVARHEIFAGASRRDKCKRYGLWVTLCPSCHEKVHRSDKRYIGLKREAQRRGMKAHGWTTEQFIAMFGRNYL